MPRFSILEHDHPHRHWDLLLESGAVLRSWRLSAPPGAAADLTAEATPDHRLLYLDYEGPVSGGRGHVTRWDAGSFAWLEDGSDRVAVRLCGVRVRGVLVVEGTRVSWQAEGG